MLSRTILVCTLLLPTDLLAAQTPEPAIRQAEEALAAALIAKDAATFERLLAPGFVLRGAPDVDRSTWIRNALSMCWGPRYDISDFSVSHTSADTAVASLVLTTTQDPVTCEPATVRSLLTDVWVRRDGRYQLVLRHSGPAGDVSAQFAKTAPPPPRWERTAEISLVATGGNTDTQTLGTAGSIVWRPGEWETRARAAFVRSATADTTTAESLLAEFRQSRALSPRAQVFGRVDYLRDRFAGLDHRLTVDAGVAWTLLETPGARVSADAGLGVTREARLAGLDETFGAGRFGMASRWRPFRTTHVEERALFTVDLGEAGNWRLHNMVGVSVAMTRLLSLKLSHDLKHAARPVAGFERTDTILSAALVARF